MSNTQGQPLTWDTTSNAFIPCAVALAAAYIPTLNQNTSGSAGSVTGLSVTSGKTLSVSNTLTLSGTDSTIMTFPGSSDTVVGLAATQTLTNKTLASPTLTTPVLGTPASGNLANCNFPTLNQNTSGSAGSVTGLSVTSGKTLTANNTLTLAGTDATTMTFPSTSGTVVTLAATQTLTNKTLTSPTLTTPTLGTPSSGNLASCTFPTLNQNTSGTAAGLTGTPAITVAAITCTTIGASGLITAQANIHCGVAGTTSGVVTLEGSASGACTITAPATAGTATNPIAFSNSVNLSGTSAVYQVNGTAGITHAAGAPTSLTTTGGLVTAFSTSDVRLKKDIVPFTRGLADLVNVRPITYRWEDEHTAYPWSGFSAQQVAESIPEASPAMPDGILDFHYQCVLAVAVNAIRELAWRVGALEEQLRKS